MDGKGVLHTWGGWDTYKRLAHGMGEVGWERIKGVRGWQRKGATRTPSADTPATFSTTWSRQPASKYLTPPNTQGP